MMVGNWPYADASALTRQASVAFAGLPARASICTKADVRGKVLLAHDRKENRPLDKLTVILT